MSAPLSSFEVFDRGVPTRYADGGAGPPFGLTLPGPAPPEPLPGVAGEPELLRNAYMAY